MQKLPIINSEISTGSYQAFIDELVGLSQKESSSYVCVTNVHMLMEAQQSPDFTKVVNSANISTPDGVPVAKGLSWLHGVNQPRVAGMDLIESLFERSEQDNLKIFLFGSTDKVLNQIQQNAKIEFPNLNIVGAISPPFRVLNHDEKTAIVEQINSQNPDFVFVALGCPKQENWMAEHKGKIHSCMIGLGGAFPVYAGFVPRAPEWMQRNGLEWFFRLYKEPRRLWKRYSYTNSKFVVLFLIQLIKLRIFKKKPNKR